MMRTDMRRWLTICLVLTAPAAWAKGKTKARPQRRADVVVCEFRWPSGLSADVGYRWTRTKRSKPAYDVSLTSRMVMVADAAGLRVEFRDWTDAVGSGPSGGSSLLAQQRPAIIVDRKGAFVRVDAATNADDEIRFATAHGIPDPSREGRKLLGEGLPVLDKARAGRTWQMLVESWAGAGLEIGADYDTDFESPSPLLPGEKLKSKISIRAERRLDCPDDASKRCVELKMRNE